VLLNGSTRRKGVDVEVEVVKPLLGFDTGRPSNTTTLFLEFVEETSDALRRV